MLLLHIDAEKSVFTDVETMVSQASDIVTNGFDFSSVVVEVDETDDAEEHRIA